ncbi:hypothetical protein B0H66DRAFT_637441 [Apodospora peruviana]|uniref:Uncharacterized protein n=1 Tax=Apodospora peruviana TaxID=516989 RepID=A0AAE0IJE1_9PEZI|nr:hypothetical protein B0H66DRAFT_637441 [Apodospora peruviana]
MLQDQLLPALVVMRRLLQSSSGSIPNLGLIMAFYMIAAQFRRSSFKTLKHTATETLGDAKEKQKWCPDRFDHITCLAPTTALLFIFGIHARHLPRTTTWFSTSFISEGFHSSRTVKYGNTAVTPVPTSTAPIVEVSSYLSEPTMSRNINSTTWTTVTVTEPLITSVEIVYTTPLAPPTVTQNVTTTEIWTSPVVATITLPAVTATCTNGAAAASGPSKKVTVTKYTGTYQPIPGQVTTTKTIWPTAVTTYLSVTPSYRVFPYTGSTVTVTSTFTDTAYLSTTISTATYSAAGPWGYRYTVTRYRSTVTATQSDYQLAYVTPTVSAGGACDSAAEPETAVTVTRAAQCAPTNLLSERDRYGVAIRILPLDWSFPIGFPNKVIGIPDVDASACCQLCVDNEGCAASEWTTGWDSACRLLYYNNPTCKSTSNETCGREVPLEYYGDSWALPGQASFIQVGCGRLTYLGVRDPFCPACVVNLDGE